MSTKPIFIVKLPMSITLEEFDRYYYLIDDKLTDYYVICYKNNKDYVEFECFYEKDFNEIKYNELKELVKKQMKIK